MSRYYAPLQRDVVAHCLAGSKLRAFYCRFLFTLGQLGRYGGGITDRWGRAGGGGEGGPRLQL